MKGIACVGIVVADLVGRPIDQLPTRGRLGLVDQMSLHVGGCAANTAVDLVRLGAPASVLGKVGADGLGDYVQRHLEVEGVDVRGLKRDISAMTSATMVLVSSDGERTFLHHLGASARYSRDEVDWGIVTEAAVLHVAGALVLPGLDGEPMARLLARAHDAGLRTSLDTVWDATGKWMGVLEPVLPHVDIFTPSAPEAEQITGRSDPDDMALFLLDRGVGVAAIKLGADGCLVRSADSRVRVPAYRVPVADGTGSGDAWDAGFIYGEVAGWDRERSARFANAVGAMCVMEVGAVSGVMSRQETERFMEEHSVGGGGDA